MEEVNLVDQVKQLHDLFVKPELEKREKKEKKKKKIKIPRKAKVRKRRIKKGWVGILRVDENGNIIGERQKIEGSAFNTSDGTYHATDANNGLNGQEILFWKGKFPVIIQETKKKNPVRFNSSPNETYGQKYIMALMNKDLIKQKKSLGGNWLIWVIAAVVIFFVVKTIIDRGGIA